MIHRSGQPRYPHAKAYERAMRRPMTPEECTAEIALCRLRIRQLRKAIWELRRWKVFGPTITRMTQEALSARLWDWTCWGVSDLGGHEQA